MTRKKEQVKWDWEKAVRRRPTPVEVARLVDSHGFDVAQERWPHVGTRTLYSDWRKGQKIIAKRCKQSEAKAG